MNKKQPLVSIYIPTKDRYLLLQRAVQSALSQSYQNIEVIVVIDASTDETLNYLKKLSQNDTRVHFFVHLKPKGASYCRNLAISHSKGYFITGLDDDDYFCKDRVLQLVEAYREKYAFVCSNILELKNNGEFVNRDFGLRSGEFGIKKVLHNNLVGNQILTTKVKMDEIGGFDTAMPAFQDYDTWVRLLRQHPLALKIPSRNYVLEKEHQSLRISNSTDKKLAGFERFIKKNKDLLTKSQMKSMNIIKYKITDAHYGIKELMSTIHWQNYKSAINLYLIRNIPRIKRIIEKLGNDGNNL